MCCFFNRVKTWESQDDHPVLKPPSGWDIYFMRQNIIFNTYDRVESAQGKEGEGEREMKNRQIFWDRIAFILN